MSDEQKIKWLVMQVAIADFANSMSGAMPAKLLAERIGVDTMSLLPIYEGLWDVGEKM